jgi:L-ascorbate metabolism protein UlaG (beta-lactamase superfamily)
MGTVRSRDLPRHWLGKKRTSRSSFPLFFGISFVFLFMLVSSAFSGELSDERKIEGINEIDIAFLPMNVPYTMTPEMAADAARAFKPKILYPYHYNDTDTSKLLDLLKDDKEIEVRIRKMQ